LEKGDRLRLSWINLAPEDVPPNPVSLIDGGGDTLSGRLKIRGDSPRDWNWLLNGQQPASFFYRRLGSNRLRLKSQLFSAVEPFGRRLPVIASGRVVVAHLGEAAPTKSDAGRQHSPCPTSLLRRVGATSELDTGSGIKAASDDRVGLLHPPERLHLPLAFLLLRPSLRGLGHGAALLPRRHAA